MTEDVAFDKYSAELSQSRSERLSNGALVTLLGRSLEGDQEAWGRLWEQGLRMVLKIVNKMSYNGVLRNLSPEEAISVGNAEIGEALLNWVPKKGAYSTWVWVWVRQAILNADRHADEGHVELVEEWASSTNSGPEDAVWRQEIQAAVEALDRPSRDLILGHFYQGLSQSDLSAVWGLSRQRVNQLILEGLIKLNSVLGEHEKDSLDSYQEY